MSMLLCILARSAGANIPLVCSFFMWHALLCLFCGTSIFSCPSYCIYCRKRWVFTNIVSFELYELLCRFIHFCIVISKSIHASPNKHKSTYFWSSSVTLTF